MLYCVSSQILLQEYSQDSLVIAEDGELLLADLDGTATKLCPVSA